MGQKQWHSCLGQQAARDMAQEHVTRARMSERANDDQVVVNSFCRS